MTQKQVLIVDMNVIAHNILHVVESLGVAAYDLNKIVEAQMLWVASGKWLMPEKSHINKARGFIAFDSVPTVIWCNDTKPYWRSAYLLRDDIWSKITPIKRGKPQAPAPIVYKGKRAESPTRLNLIRSSMRFMILKYRWSIFEGLADSTHGYEADDMAALLVRINRISPEPAQLYLLTCDHDWIGLIDVHTSWMNTYGAFPRYRRLSNWNVGYGGLPAADPVSLWALKAATGDKSDNLPNVAGDPLSVETLLPVISLEKPPEQFDPMNYTYYVKQAQCLLRSPVADVHYSFDRYIDNLMTSRMKLAMTPLHHAASEQSENDFITGVAKPD